MIAPQYEAAVQPGAPSLAEFEAIVRSLQSPSASERQEAQRVLQQLQHTREDCCEMCLSFINATTDPAVATVAASTLRISALWHWKAKILAVTAAQRRAIGRLTADTINVDAAARDLHRYASLMHQRLSSIVMLLERRASAGLSGCCDRQLVHCICVLAKQGLATSRTVLEPLMDQMVKQATSTPVESPQPVFWISLLTELSREMQLPQQQGMQVSFKEQSGCCRFFQKAVFFPFVAHSLRRLEYLLNAGPALDAELVHLVAVLEVLASWRFFGPSLTIEEPTLVLVAEWMPVFFGSNLTSAEHSDCPREPVFALVLRLYKFLRSLQGSSDKLFSTARFVLQRLATLRLTAMSQNCGLKSSVVYLPLLDVILDLLETSTTSEQARKINASQDISKDQYPCEQVLEEIQDLCAALSNLSECPEALPEVVFKSCGERALRLFAQLFHDLLSLSAAGGDGADVAAEALSHLSRAWSRWGSRLVEVIAKQANVPDHELSQTRVSDESFWRQFRDAAGVVVESFIKKGLAACAQREDAKEVAAGATYKEEVFLVRSGSQLHDFLNSLSVLSSLNLTRALSEAGSRLRELGQRQREQLAAAAAAAGEGDQQRVVLHLKGVKETQQLEHWLLLYLQFLVASVQTPRALTPKIVPSKELLQDTSAQTELLRLLEVFFALMEDQVALLIDTAGATATNSPVFTHQLLLQVHQQQVSPAVLEAGFDIVILVTRTYLFKENLAKPVLADLLLPEGAQKVLNKSITLVAGCLSAAAKDPSLSYACARTIQTLARDFEPCCAYLWESHAFQSLIDLFCRSCAQFLLPLANTTNAASGNLEESSRTDESSLLHVLNSRVISTLFSSFAVAAAPSAYLKGLAAQHIAKQRELESEEQLPFLRSGTNLSNEVAAARTEALLARCAVGLEVLQAAAKATHVAVNQLPLEATRWVLSMLGGLLVGRETLRWLAPALPSAFVVTRAAACHSEVLRVGLKFLRRLARVSSSLSEGDLRHLVSECRQVLAAFAATLGSISSTEEEDAAFSNASQIFNMETLARIAAGITLGFLQRRVCGAFCSLRLLKTVLGDNISPKADWVLDSVVECLTALKPLCEKLTPFHPKVMASYLSVVTVLLDKDANRVVAQMAPSDAGLMVVLLQRGLLSGQSRLASPAVEGISVLSLMEAKVQYRQGLYSSATNSAGAADVFERPLNADSFHEVYVQFAQLGSMLLVKMSREDLSSTEQDLLAEALYAVLFCVGIQAGALNSVFKSFLNEFSASQGEVECGPIESYLVQRVEEMQRFILEVVESARPKDQQGELRILEYRKAESPFKVDLATFVADFATHGQRK